MSTKMTFAFPFALMLGVAMTSTACVSYDEDLEATSQEDESLAEDVDTDSSALTTNDTSNATNVTVKATIVVKKGETFDGSGKKFIADADALGDGSQDEGQKPVFKLEDGAKLKNVTLGAPAADGIHTYGNVTLENVVWEDIGEDALTIKSSGTVVLNGGSAQNGDDKVFQINAASTFKVSNFKASNAGKFIRQNGGTTFKVAVEIDNCDISGMKESIFRTDSKTSTVKMTNTKYSKIGKQLFMGVDSKNITQSNNTQY
ncbi:pectate lyase [Polyangium aurulentum]|uniref:pectate lyase n=1 Tax=Polyangium aurulentum TaxID=2567896 RepID=UPI0023DFCE37|nr:pectate lyase [Polyangium aurulentum]